MSGAACLLNLGDLDLLSECLKPSTSKRLGEDINELIFCADVLNQGKHILNASPDEVVSHLCVLASVMPSWNIGFLHN
jgi:hypothetical protein